MSEGHKDILARLQRRIEEICEREIAPLFTRDIRITVIARKPWNDEADVLVTCDDVEEVKLLLSRRSGDSDGPTEHRLGVTRDKCQPAAVITPNYEAAARKMAGYMWSDDTRASWTAQAKAIVDEALLGSGGSKCPPHRTGGGSEVRRDQSRGSCPGVTGGTA